MSQAVSYMVCVYVHTHFYLMKWIITWENSALSDIVQYIAQGSHAGYVRIPGSLTSSLSFRFVPLFLHDLLF